ncbi:MAG: hypothetical protein B7Z37_29805 [Verrucomicrobia bacterium 12-59-8]|nr:MAG: hypothetical protein B7Z37_29805 [Verrucomicrobia bacterium 12-59-8]
MQQSWVWVPGYEWAPAWVSWRQTQGQIGWAPLPPEAAWAPGIGFGGWTDSYYDVGPSYYNFVPIGMFASAVSLRPFILDRSRNFNYYDQSINITHTSYRPNIMNHIFVGGPDPQRIDGFGSNHVRRLTLRRDDEGFRRNWLDNDRRGNGNGGPPRGAGSSSRIEQGQLFIVAPSIRRDASHALPSRVREPMHQPVIDRGWRGAPDAQSSDRMRQQQRDELARTRPPQLPEKNLRPVTSTAPPPAFGRDLQAHERIGGGKGGANGTTPRHVTEEVRTPTTPKKPLPSGGPPGIPVRVNEVPGNRGAVPSAGPSRSEPNAHGQQSGQMPGQRPGENKAPTPGGTPHIRSGISGAPQGIPSQPAAMPQHITPQNMRPEHKGPQSPASPQQRLPNAPDRQSEIPSRHQAPPSAQPPAERPHMRPQPGVPPTPPAPQQRPPVHAQPPQGGAPPPSMPAAPPPHRAPPPSNNAPQHPGAQGKR